MAEVFLWRILARILLTVELVPTYVRAFISILHKFLNQMNWPRILKGSFSSHRIAINNFITDVLCLTLKIEAFLVEGDEDLYQPKW